MRCYLMIKYILLILTLMALPLHADPRDYQQKKCDLPQNQDHWEFREPTDAEVFEFGVGVVIFEYWNSKENCSDDIYQGVYYNNWRFMLEVTVGGRDVGFQEQIVLTVDDAPYHVGNTLLIPDNTEPGKIILYPLIG